MATQNRYLEAFKENHNIVGLAAVAAASAALLTPVPILAGLVAETVYLLFVPDSKWFQARLSARYDAEVAERRKKLKDQVFPSLTIGIQTRFDRLETVRNQISDQTVEGKKWFREVLRKLDYLLEKFLLFANKEVEFDRYLRSVLAEVSAAVPPPPPGTFEDDDRPKRRKADSPPEVQMPSGDEWVKQTVKRVQDNYSAEIAGIDALLQRDENLHNQAVLDKRKEVLSRRQQYVGQIGETLTNLRHQLQLIEDTFGLINDEIRARSPEQVLADIDDVVNQTDTLTEALQDVSPFDLATLPAGSERLYNVKEEPHP